MGLVTSHQEAHARVQIFNGNPKGEHMTHIKACHTLALSLLNTPPDNMNSHTRDLRDFVLETYTYHVLIMTITPFDQHARSQSDLLLGPLMSSAQSRPEQQCGTYGCMVAEPNGFLEIIPLMNTMCWERQLAIAGGHDLDYTTTMFIALEKRILGLKTAPAASTMDQREIDADATVLEVYRHALVIYLYSSLWPGQAEPHPEYVTLLQKHASACLQLIGELQSTPRMTILLWSAIISASCLRDHQSQEEIRYLASTTGPHVGIVSRAMELLEMLWKEKDEFGPYGLHVIMKQQDFCLLIA
ncbi:hypothetical protein G7054_g11359 [Neopestalotiopsis clavispora]|nr:hypothetical protein G7054_g11359 [Neopestalotiopsis clavispora]